MIVILNGADFSQNNLGTIELPYVYNDITLQAIAASGNSSMTDIQKRKLDRFFMNIGAVEDDGIFAKIRKLYLPMIAGSKSEAFVNYKSSDFHVDITLDASVALVNGGVKEVGSENTQNMLADSSFEFDWHNISTLIAYNDWTQGTNYDHGRYYFIAPGEIADQYTAFNNSSSTDGTLRAFYVNSNSKVFTNSILPANKKAFGISFINEYGYGIGANGTIETLENNFPNDKRTRALYILAWGLSGNVGSFTNAYGVPLMVIGNGLTQEELIYLKNQLDILMESFLG